MEKFKKEFISIIQAAFSEKAESISSDFDWEKAIDVAKKHNIVPIVYYGAIACGISNDEKFMEELNHLTLKSVLVSVRQTYEIEQIEKVFEAEKIEYMPLKGTILKDIYPKPEMRTMGDADVLIKLEQYPKIESIMKELQFSFKYESDHELIWDKPALFLELHKSIMTTYNEDFYRYFGTGWGIAKSVPNSSRYEMTAEDFYIYAFVHFTKHYRITGIGIKHLIDLWVYSNARSELDWEYVEKELKKMKLFKFHNNVRNTIDVWFNGAAETDATELITNVIFNSGQYGSAETAIINRALQKGEKSTFKLKFERVFQSVFLPFEVMKEKYAILCYVPLLLPFMWIVRCFQILFYQNKRLRRFFNTINKIDSTKLDENKQALYIVGLDFENK